MRCRICGAKLRKEGDICKSCYEEYCKEEELEKDVKEVYKIHRKYLPKYQLTRYMDWYFISIFIIIAFMAQGQFLFTMLYLLMALIALGVAMFVEKRNAVNTTCTFYDKKIVWRYKDRKKTIAYSDLKEITYYQNFFQKMFNLADVLFHPEGGTYLMGGFQIKNVPDFENTWKNIEQIIETKREK